MRILEVINKTKPYFEKQGIESPRLTIELLLAHLLKKKRMELYLEFERELDEATLTQLREMVKRRVAGEPLQYITGEVEFCGLKLLVDRRVLIPRRGRLFGPTARTLRLKHFTKKYYPAIVWISPLKDVLHICMVKRSPNF